MSTVRLLDVSGIFWPLWSVGSVKGDSPRKIAEDCIRALRERAASTSADYVVACCDSGKSFRHEIAKEYLEFLPQHAGYKGTRPDKDPAMMAALDRVIAELDTDGVPIFSAEGFEADDVVATLARWAVSQGHSVECVSDDKDLRQLIREPEGDEAPHVWVMTRRGERIGRAEVIAKFGVPPERLGDFLAMVGDTSDNVEGLPQIGPERAANLIKAFPSFQAMVNAAVRDQAYAEQCERELAAARERKERPLPKFDKPRFQDATRRALISGDRIFAISRRLVELRTDVPLDVSQVTAPHVPKPRPKPPEWAKENRPIPDIAEPEQSEADYHEEEEQMTTEQQPTSTAEPLAPVMGAGADRSLTVATPANATGAIQRASNGDRLLRYVLEPRTYQEARDAAMDAADSGLYKGITTPQQALMVIMMGRKYGLTVADSLSKIHMIEGKPSLSAQFIIGLVLSSGFAEYLEYDEVTEASATWITKRRGARKEKAWTFTVENAKSAMLGGVTYKDGKYSDFDPKSNWAKHPKVMCLWRAGVFLCRAVYTDLVGGLYMPDELGGKEPEIDGNQPVYGEIIQVAA